MFCTAIMLAAISLSSCRDKKAAAAEELNPEETQEELLAEVTEDIPQPEAPDNILHACLFGSTEGPFAPDSDGLEELGFGYYDGKTGIYHSCIEENGPYIQELAYLNEMFLDNQISAPEEDQAQQAMAFSYNTKSLCEAAELVTQTLRTDSWEAIQATSTDKFKQAVKKLQINAKTYGIDELDAYYVKQASLKKAGKL